MGLETCRCLEPRYVFFPLSLHFTDIYLLTEYNNMTTASTTAMALDCHDDNSEGRGLRQRVSSPKILFSSTTSVRHGYGIPGGLTDTGLTGTGPDRGFPINLRPIPVSIEPAPAMAGLY